MNASALLPQGRLDHYGISRKVSDSSCVLILAIITTAMAQDQSTLSMAGCVDDNAMASCQAAANTEFNNCVASSGNQKPSCSLVVVNTTFKISIARLPHAGTAFTSAITRDTLPGISPTARPRQRLCLTSRSQTALRTRAHATLVLSIWRLAVRFSSRRAAAIVRTAGMP